MKSRIVSLSALVLAALVAQGCYVSAEIVEPGPGPAPVPRRESYDFYLRSRVNYAIELVVTAPDGDRHRIGLLPDNRYFHATMSVREGAGRYFSIAYPSNYDYTVCEGMGWESDSGRYLRLYDVYPRDVRCPSDQTEVSMLVGS